MSEVRRRTSCRICGGRDLTFVLSLGPSPLANAFLAAPAEFAGERRYPLDLYYCERCTLLQLVDVVDPEILFRHYIYVTGTSDTMQAHNVANAAAIVARLDLQPADLVVEAASNDGSLLRCFARAGVRTLGIEPATNLAAVARSVGVETVNAFFNIDTAREVRASHGPARVVIGNNVLAHVDDPVEFLGACRELVDPTGLVSIEVPYVRDLLDRLEYDTIYHEHLSYFSITSLLHASASAGLAVVGVERLPVHGGSLRLSLRRDAEGHAVEVLAMEAEERAAGIADVGRYRRFAVAVQANRAALVGLLDGLRADGKRLAGYGAPAKGNTLLNYCGIDTRLLPYTVDKNPLKVGLYTPGAHVPVRPVSALTESIDEMPDYVLVLAWNFADEIVRQQQVYRDRGGLFIRPIPEPQVM
jgi:hypothetical protein